MLLACSIQWVNEITIDPHMIANIIEFQEYDYNSITHYSSFAFARDKTIPTIKAKLELYASKMGQRKGSCHIHSVSTSFDLLPFL